MNIASALPSNFSITELLKFIDIPDQLSEAITEIDADNQDLQEQLEHQEEVISKLDSKLECVVSIVDELGADIYDDDLDVDEVISLVRKAIAKLYDLTEEQL
jgi:ATP:corrinoid adenosyltransferase